MSTVDNVINNLLDKQRYQLVHLE